MDKHRFVGRLSVILGLIVLGPACVGGEISSTGSSRFSPDPNDPGVGNGFDDPSPGDDVDPDPTESPLVCADASVDVSASSGWKSSRVAEPAAGTLRFAFKARPTAADLDGVIAVGAAQIDTFTEAAILVRFAEDGFVDARDGAVYSSDINYAYDPGIWYDIAVTADTGSKTYDVQIGRCGEPMQTLIDAAAFRDDATVADELSGWAVWSSQSAALEMSTPSWTASGGCTPATCETLGHTCGQPGDGCGGVLSCGTCGSGQSCTAGACVNDSVPPPPCEPATCQTLGAECGLQVNGCGGFLNCGNCSTGQMCSAGTCIAEPPTCEPATCQSLGTECGQESDGCGGSLNCGGCGSGEMCSDGTCVDEPSTCEPFTCQSLGTECGQQSDGCGGSLNCGGCGSGETCSGGGQCVSSSSSDWWTSVAKPNASNTGPNCSAPGCPSASLSAGNAPPRTITQNGATYENFTMNGTLDIDANNVTLRNFSFNASGVGSGTVIENTGTNLVIEYAYINGGGGDCGQIFNSNGWTVRYSEFTNCSDIVKISDAYGNLGPVLVENSYWHDVGGGHGDTIQIWPGTSSNITFRHNTLEGGNTSIVIDWDVNAPARLLFEENWMHGGGAGYSVYCSNAGGGSRIYRDNLFDRGFVWGAVTDSGCTVWSGNLYMDNYATIPY